MGEVARRGGQSESDQGVVAVIIPGNSRDPAGQIRGVGARPNQEQERCDDGIGLSHALCVRRETSFVKRVCGCGWFMDVWPWRSGIGVRTWKVAALWKEVVGRVGFEPTTNGLKGRCSTTELPTRQVVGRLKNPNELKPFGDSAYL